MGFWFMGSSIYNVVLQSIYSRTVFFKVFFWVFGKREIQCIPSNATFENMSWYSVQYVRTVTIKDPNSLQALHTHYSLIYGGNSAMI